MGAVRRVRGKEAVAEPVAATGDTVPLLDRANTHFAAKEFEQAVDTYREYLKREKQDMDVRVRLGRSLYALGKYTAARLEFKRVLKVRPKDSQACVYAGLCFARCARLEEAARVWEDFFDLKNVELLRELNIQKGLILSGDAGHHDAVAEAVEAVLDA
jgi:Flp pilus assembly protein TadD